MKIPAYTVDAFTHMTFAGNPAAVCLLQQQLPEKLMQSIAVEFNLSETAFLQLLHPDHSFEKDAKFRLRWFTPSHEVALCGHATLATAAVLFKVLNNQNKELCFSTLSGDLIAKRRADEIILDLPLNSPIPMNGFAGDEKLSQLVKMVSCGCAVMEVHISNAAKKLLVRLSNDVTLEELQKLDPPIDELMEVHSTGEIMGVILTVKGTRENGCIDADDKVYDFISRYFAPWHGIKEDPVTGSAHTVLAGYWAKCLNNNNLYARQCSKRGGELKIQVHSNERIDIAGNSVVFLQGMLSV